MKIPFTYNGSNWTVCTVSRTVTSASGAITLPIANCSMMMRKATHAAITAEHRKNLAVL